MSTARRLKIVKAEIPKPTTKFEAFFDQASDAILTLSSNSKIDETNMAFTDMTGWSRDELRGKDISTLQPSEGTHHLPDRSRALEPLYFEQEGTFEDIAVLRKDGLVRLIELSVRKFDSKEGAGTIALFRDVTAKKQLERELITKHNELRSAYGDLEKRNLELQALQDTLVQAGKMAALGELAAGIAHELNQPLMGIRGYAQELQEINKASSVEQNICLKEIISNADKMAKIIRYLRTFTRKSTEDYQMVNIHEAIDESLKMLAKQFETRGIEVVQERDPDLPKIYANPLQIEQVFINLATNARDAIEATERGSGKITIITQGKDQLVEIRFRDNGVGMDNRSKRKMFNPFFTTKEVGKGMGLGMSISYGILNKINGAILVESEVGKGTEFLIRIPQDFREMG